MTRAEPRSAHSRALRLLWWTLILVAVASVLAVTLLPQASRRGENWIPLAQSGPALRALLRSGNPLQHPAFRFLLFQVVGNVAAFVPLGFGVAGLQASSGKKIFVPAVLAGVVLSLIIETIQLGLPTRATDVDDVLFNTLGAALGAGLFLLARGRTPQRRRRSAGR